MSVAYAAATKVDARPGAMTLTDLAALPKATLLIPSPNVAEDQQTKNALHLSEKDDDVLLKDEDARKSGVTRMMEMVQKPEDLKILRENIFSFYRPHADQAIVDEVIKIAKLS